jgi:hypothetical protein
MAVSVINSKKSEYQEFIPNSTNISILGVIAKTAANKYMFTTSIPVPKGKFAEITCSEYRPAGQYAVTETSPEINWENNFLLSISTMDTNFEPYVGKQGFARVMFVYK